MPHTGAAITLVWLVCIGIIIWVVALELRAAPEPTRASSVGGFAIAGVSILAAACALAALMLAVALD